MRKTIIGFDRKIRLQWLDATAAWAAQQLPTTEIRMKLDKLLEGVVSGSGSHSARGKTKTVLLHIWALVPDRLVPLRDDGLILLNERSSKDRLTLHWGMCVATYPFFRDVATITGRLLAVQGNATLPQVMRRMTEVWGDRSTLIRAVQRVIRCFVDWGVLQETEHRGIFCSTQKQSVAGDRALALWMLEAAVSNGDTRSRPFRSVISYPAFFPFSLELPPHEVSYSSRLELHRFGLDEDVVVLRESR